MDDNEDFLRAESAWLAIQPGFEIVGTARSGETALEVVPQLRPDIVLMDLAMPGIGGFEAIRALKQLPSPPAIIAVSLHDSQVVRSEAAMAGADGFVPKARLSALLVPALHGVHGAARPTTEEQPPAEVGSQRMRLRGEPQAGAPPSPGSGSGHRDPDAAVWSRLLAAVAERLSRASWLARGGRAGAPAPVGD